MKNIMSSLLLTFVGFFCFKCAAGFLGGGNMMYEVMPRTKSGMMHLPQAPKPKPNVLIRLNGSELKGQLKTLPIIHDDVSFLKKQERPFRQYSVYIEMGTGYHYLAENLILVIVNIGQRHVQGTATIQLECTNHSAKNFEIYEVDNPYVPNTAKYAGGSGIIYVAIKGTTKVYWAIVR